MIHRYDKPLYQSDHNFISCAGTSEIDDFMLEHKPDGGVRLKKKGVIPIYKMIQAEKVNCDLDVVLETCVHENQLNVCSMDDVQQAIVDFSGMQNMAELYAGMKHLDGTWNRLPIEVREQFNSSQAAFVSGLESPDFMDKLQTGFSAYEKSINKRIDVPKPEVIPDIKPDIEPDGGDE